MHCKRKREREKEREDEKGCENFSDTSLPLSISLTQYPFLVGCELVQRRFSLRRRHSEKVYRDEQKVNYYYYYRCGATPTCFNSRWYHSRLN